MLLEEATWSVGNAAAVYNLLSFLRNLRPAYCSLETRTLAGPKKLEIVGLELWEKSNGFRSDAARLLTRCNRTKEVALVVDIREIPFTRSSGYPAVDLEALEETHDFEQMVEAQKLEGVKIGLIQFMSLERTLGGLRGEKVWAERLMREKGDMLEVEGVDTFWGMKEWLEDKSRHSGRRLEVAIRNEASI